MALSIFDLITIERVKGTTVAGVDLTFDDGSDYPDSLFESAIAQSVALLEAELGIIIDPFSIKGERHDIDLIDRHSHYHLSLDLKPLKSIDQLAIKIGNSEGVGIMPNSYASIASYQHSKLNLIPDSTVEGGLRFSGGVPFLVGDVFSPYSRFPQYFSIDYTAGFTFEEGTATIPQGQKEVVISTSNEFTSRPYVLIEITDAQGGSGLRVVGSGTNQVTVAARVAPTTGDLTFNYTVHNVDPLIERALLLLSALLPLNIAGDLIAGAGVASQSISIDSLSQSLATTASATSAGYGARLIAFNDELKKVTKTLRGKYSQMNIYAR
jgi:hypothetical protein